MRMWHACACQVVAKPFCFPTLSYFGEFSSFHTFRCSWLKASGLIIFNNQHSAVTWSHFGGRPTPRHVQYASAAMLWVSSQMNAALEKDASPEVRCLFDQKSPRMHHFILSSSWHAHCPDTGALMLFRCALRWNLWQH